MKLFYSSVDDHLNCNAVVNLVSAHQINGKVSIKIVVYNLDTKPLLIHSIEVYKKINHNGIFKRLFQRNYQEIEDGIWWPKYEDNSVDRKCFADEYENVYIKELMDFQVVFTGDLYKDLYSNEKDIYKFIINTNKGTISRLSPININGCYFSHRYYESRSYKI
jgi:hypothetical protein